MTYRTIFLSETQLEALTSPRTREVFDEFMQRGSMSVPEVQRALCVPSKTLYYQVRKLVGVGLLREGRRSGGGGVRYEPTAKKVLMPSGFQGAKYEELAAKSVDVALKRASRRFSAAAAASAEKPSITDDQLILTATLRLSRAHRRGLRAELRAVIERYKRLNSEGEPPISLVVVSSPLVGQTK